MIAHEYYNEKYRELSDEIAVIKKKRQLNALIRGIVFIGGISLSIWLFRFDPLYTWIGMIASLLPFFFLVRRSVSLQSRQAYLLAKHELNAQEINALDGDYSAFYDGAGFTENAHFYAKDLDVFGIKSIYQAICRTYTFSGKKRLAQWLNSPLTDTDAITLRQEAIAELAKKNEFRQHFVALSKLIPQESDSRFVNFLSTRVYPPAFSFLHKIIYRILFILLPVLSVVVLALLVLKVIYFLQFLAYLFVLIGITGLHITKIQAVYTRYSGLWKALKQYAGLLDVIESETFGSQKMKDIQAGLQAERHTAGQQLAELSALLNAFDNRNNMLFAILSNGLVLWDMQCAYRLEKWEEAYGGRLQAQIDSIAEVDALVSLGGFLFNNPDFTFAQVQQGNSFIFDQAAHPLLSSSTRVANSFSLQSPMRMALLTGANMAGKSTFLRTIGINLVLALAGAPVCARKLVCSPVQVLSSMRNDDSLQSNESYFYAELKRLKQIVEYAQSGQAVFIILDEILRGTNSNDKHKGSEGLIRKLLSLQACGILATHDITLGKLADEYAGELQNFCFEVEIREDELFFDYTLHHGISQSLNASFLMKKMEIV